MSFSIDIQNTLEPEPRHFPGNRQIIEWAKAALADECEIAEMTIRITDVDEISTLNQTYRNKSGPTNVLSFPADLPEEIDLPLLGDIIICADVVKKESLLQNKSLESHWAHMVIHGTLHLLGYDHAINDEAEVMEAKEIEILKRIGYPNPYMVIDK